MLDSGCSESLEITGYPVVFSGLESCICGSFFVSLYRSDSKIQGNERL
jgi:hypothetical protein